MRARASRPPRGPRLARAGALGVLALVLAGAGPVLPPVGAPLDRWPLDPPVVTTGGFGETRSNHFHAGYDFSTGGSVGKPVYSPVDGWVERVRASGVGYGRSLYVHAHDGRIVVYGHLDAFADPLAAWVDSVQAASGVYEQDLWPEPRRFPVQRGQRIAWSGNSGAGGPHLHLEVRRGDFALHPRRAGFPVLKPETPRLDSVTFDPVDDTSYVARRAGPLTRRLGATAETLVVEGRVRATLQVEDTALGGATTPAWSASATWNGETTEVRFDSLSWATDMGEIDHVFDRGRVAGTRGVVLHAAAGFRPRVLASPQPLEREVGAITVRPGDPARRLDLVARAPSGAQVRRAIWLRGPRRGELGPDTLAAGRAPAGPLAWRFVSLPDRGLRVRVTGTPAGLSRVWIVRGMEGFGGRPATWDGGGWTCVLRMSGLPDAEGFWIRGRLPDGQPWVSRGAFAVWPGGADLPIRPEEGVESVIPLNAVTERGTAVSVMAPRTDAPEQGLVGRSPVLRLMPESLPLRSPASVQMTLGPGADPARVGLYHRAAGDAWSLLRGTWDERTRRYTSNTSRLGEFALFADATAPVVARVPAPALPSSAASPYSRWALAATVREEGSGLDASESHIAVDGRRVPTEWDPEANVLRWRPRVPPAPGSYDVVITATDRAGNRTVIRDRITLRAVLRSGPR